MAVLFLGPDDTRGGNVSADALEWYVSGPEPYEIIKVKATELETLWSVRHRLEAFSTNRVVTNRYEPAHELMRDAYERQERIQGRRS